MSDLIRDALEAHLSGELGDLVKLYQDPNIEDMQKEIESRLINSGPRAAPVVSSSDVPLYIKGGDNKRRSEPRSPSLSDLSESFQVDLSRIRHSAAFRSLGGKKQIF